tara:strand:+ start:78 stop:788 length:711 start_codon:yes stop_codon:yes gene_type:complete
MLAREALKNIGGLSKPSKMPCPGFSIPADTCGVGSKLAVVPGSVCNHCYARKGMYQFPVVKNALYKRHDILVKALNTDTSQFKASFKTLLKKQTHFRWHDSGDIISADHLKLICEIAQENDHVQFWIPTREFKIVSDYFKVNTKPSNLIVRLSATKVDAIAPEKMARNHSLVVSGVHTKNTSYVPCDSKYTTDGTFTKNGEPNTGFCSGTDTRSGKKVDCRKCWNPGVFSVSYPIH